MRTNVKKNLERNISKAKFKIFVAGRAVLKVLDSRTVKSRCTMQCFLFLIHIQEHDIRLYWVPVHSSVPGKEIADECGRLGSCELDDTATVDVCFPFDELKNHVDELGKQKKPGRAGNQYRTRK